VASKQDEIKRLLGTNYVDIYEGRAERQRETGIWGTTGWSQSQAPEPIPKEGTDISQEEHRMAGGQGDVDVEWTQEKKVYEGAKLPEQGYMSVGCLEVRAIFELEARSCVCEGIVLRRNPDGCECEIESAGKG
jgi:hypothetical protein